MAWFNYGYSTSNLIPYQRISFVTDRGYAGGTGPPSGIQVIAPAREFDYPDRDRPMMEREPEFNNQYSEPEQELPGDYPFHNFNYGP